MHHSETVNWSCCACVCVRARARVLLKVIYYIVGVVKDRSLCLWCSAGVEVPRVHMSR